MNVSLASHLACCLVIACIVVLSCGRAPAAVAVYETDFESFTPGDDQLVGADGWTGTHVGEGVHGIDEGRIEGLGKTAFLGFNPPSSDFVGVARSVDYDPLGAGNPTIEFFSLVGIADSTNGEFDRFYISFYNINDDLLGAIVFDNTADDFGVLRSDGNELVHTGELFVNDEVQGLFVSIDFSTNTWSAKLDGLPVFANETFNATGAALDLGSVAAEWEVMKPNKPGDNWMLFDEWTVTAHGDDQPTNSYAEWLETYFKDLHMDPLADADDDGLNNLFEFGIGTNPLVSEGNEGVGAIPKLRVMPDSAPASFYYEFVTARTLPPGVQLEVLQSSTLNASDWEIIASRQGNEPWSGSAVAAGKLEEVAVVEEGKTQIRILENDSKDVVLRFYRLQVVVSLDHALAEKVAWRWK